MTQGFDPVQPQTVIFMHMPKAGGSTMNHIVDWNYDTIFSLAHYNRIPAFIALPEDKKRRIDCVKGPIFYGIHRYLPQECTYITLIRHPVQRVISQYYYDFRRKRRLGQRVPNWTIEKYLEIAPFHPTYQLRLLVGGADIESVLHDPLPKNAIAIARQHLAEHFAVAGVTDYYDETLLLMKHALGWTRAFYARQNIDEFRESRNPLPAITMQLLEHECAAEMELYEFVKQQTEDLIAAQDASFRHQLEQLQRANRRFERLWNLAGPVRNTRPWNFVRSTVRTINRRL